MRPPPVFPAPGPSKATTARVNGSIGSSSSTWKDAIGSRPPAMLHTSAAGSNGTNPSKAEICPPPGVVGAGPTAEPAPALPQPPTRTTAPSVATTDLETQHPVPSPSAGSTGPGSRHCGRRRRRGVPEDGTPLLPCPSSQDPRGRGRSAATHPDGGGRPRRGHDLGQLIPSAAGRPSRGPDPARSAPAWHACSPAPVRTSGVRAPRYASPAPASHPR
jgi:hypothetical protein